MRLPPHRLALAVGEPYEARLLALLEAATFQVAGRTCAVTRFCSTIRELRDALGSTDSIDAVVMSNSLQAVPMATLDELVAIGRPLVLVVPDPAASRWSERAVPVLGPDPDGATLAAAIGDALLGRRPVRARAASAAPSSAAKRTRSGRSSGPVESDAPTSSRPQAKSSSSPAPSCLMAAPPRWPCL